MTATTPARAGGCCTCQGSAREPGRVLLPVAPRPSARSRFAGNRKIGQAMMPGEALAWIERILDRGSVIREIDINGPGDPLAVPGPTMETLFLLGRKHGELPLGITTLGISGDLYAASLAQHGVRRITLLVDAVDPQVVRKLFAWIRPGTKTIPLTEAASILVDEQRRALTAFIKHGIAVSIWTTIYPGINDHHVEEIARNMKGLGARSMELLPCRPAAEDEPLIDAPDREMMDAIRERLAGIIPLEEMRREDVSFLSPVDRQEPAAGLPRASRKRPNVAVASLNGMEVDLHLGQTHRFLIYGPREDGLACLLGTRDAPEPGGGKKRWQELAAALDDCFALLTSSAGETPRNILSRSGISVLITDGGVEGTVDVLYGGKRKAAPRL